MKHSNNSTMQGLALPAVDGAYSGIVHPICAFR